MTLASFFSWADRFESYLVGNSEGSFSRDEAQMIMNINSITHTFSRTQEFDQLSVVR